jgi:hypothetical protein
MPWMVGWYWQSLKPHVVDPDTVTRLLARDKLGGNDSSGMLVYMPPQWLGLIWRQRFTQAEKCPHAVAAYAFAVMGGVRTP